MVWLSRQRDGKEDTNQAAGLAWLDDGLRFLAVTRVRRWQPRPEEALTPSPADAIGGSP